MTSNGPAEVAPTMTSPSSARRSAAEDGPYVLRPWVDSVPLLTDDASDDVKINCIDCFDGNLYVGTSASELLHFVELPAGPTEKPGRPVYIPASRLRPAYSDQPGAPNSSQPGVQQILLLPRVGKACVLCNWTVTFYSLPELSPIFGTTQVKNCHWIGGIDLNEAPFDSNTDGSNGVTILLSLNRRIQVVRIGDDARAYKKIDFASSILSIRRDSVACVADAKAYSLLDVDRALKIPLMSISSLDRDSPSEEHGQAQSIPESSREGITRSASSGQTRPQATIQSHSRSTSLGGSILSSMRRPEARNAEAEESVFQQPSPPDHPSTPRLPGDASPGGLSTNKPLPAAPDAQVATDNTKSTPAPFLLKPHIASPTPEEFLVVMGTSPSEPGIGMFVNLDGDATRPTLTFERYPNGIAVDGSMSDMLPTRSQALEDEDGYVLASITRDDDGTPRNGLEVQRWDAGSDACPEKHWLESEDARESGVYGIRSLSGSQETYFEEVAEKLGMRKYIPFPGPVESLATSLKTSDSRTAHSIERLSKEQELFERDFDSQDGDSLPEGWETTRNIEGEEFARRLARTSARLAVWAGDCIWWAVRNPLIVQLDTKLEAACPTGCTKSEEIDKRAIIMVLTAIRGREPKTELEFTTFGYLQQKAGVLLLINLLLSPPNQQPSDAEMMALEEVLVESKLDPRVVMSLIPGVRNEIIEGRRGIWIYGGINKSPESFLRSAAFVQIVKNGLGGLDPRVLHFLKRYFTAWRKMKGFGSVSVENQVFRTVDAALLLVLLELDQLSPKGMNKGGAVRTELYELVDKGVDCFDRAIDLLQSYHRLFVLSRLYQSRKMSADVLATWKRIVEGERDDGQEFRDGEQRVREYLTKISNQALVQEYGLWLANRNPKLGVQVFAEDKGRAPKFEPAQAAELLRREAPAAVKYYLEHLVFGKGHTTYVNELITYYLHVVIDDLQSTASQDRITAAYDAYRALEAPKPTYRHFLTENAPEDDEVWQSRLRLLQLLGGAHHYDVAAIRDRIGSLPEGLLVPENIILAGRERKHEEALRLLVHKLGDFDTAVSYCLRGGASIYSPSPGRRDSMPAVEQQRQLFQVVLREFLAIDDISDRVAQTGTLLERFGGWFELDDVLQLVPDSWSVDIVAGFLVGALRRLVREKHESMLTRALSGAENLRVSYELVKGIDEKGPSIEAPN